MTTPTLTIALCAGSELSSVQQTTLIDLCTRAFEEDFSELMATFDNSVHLLGQIEGQIEGQIVSHALWVPRWLQVGDGPLLKTAYVEAVATEPSLQNRGYATAVMKAIAAEIAKPEHEFVLAALSPFSVPWYGRLGWEQWHGPLSIRTPRGPLRTAEEDGHVMILRLPQTPPLDRHAPLSAEWRLGELW